MSSPHACPKEQFVSGWDYIPFNKWVVGALLLAIGLYFSICGYLHLQFTIAIIFAACSGLIFHALIAPLVQIPLWGMNKSFTYSLHYNWNHCCSACLLLMWYCLYLECWSHCRLFPRKYSIFSVFPSY